MIFDSRCPQCSATITLRAKSRLMHAPYIVCPTCGAALSTHKWFAQITDITGGLMLGAGLVGGGFLIWGEAFREVYILSVFVGVFIIQRKWMKISPLGPLQRYQQR